MAESAWGQPVEREIIDRLARIETKLDTVTTTCSKNESDIDRLKQDNAKASIVISGAITFVTMLGIWLAEKFLSGQH